MIVLDCTGLCCPEPIMVAHRKMRTFEGGQLVKILATDQLAEEDFKSYCGSMKHEFVECLESDGVYEILIRKLG
jgi:tRNA 2-thiouridine synthesizing protein A